METLTTEDALRAYARLWHTLDADFLLPWLAEDFHYESQWVFDEITSKAQSQVMINQVRTGDPSR